MSQPSQAPKTSFLSHPSGLYLLFFVEMWERFSYYALGNQLVRYLIKELHFTKPEASSLNSTYLMFVYLTPFFGGLLADRKLGYKRAILLGGSLMALGQFLMSTDHSQYLYALYIGLGLLCLGNGLFKPNISSMVGRLYAPDDPRKDSAFTIFYMGINLGGALGPLTAEYLSVNYGWRYGFMAAGVGMLLGLTLFQSLKERFLKGIGDVPTPTVVTASSQPTGPTSLTPTEKSRMLALFGICVIAMLFWGAFYQSYDSLQIWATDYTRPASFTLPLIGEFKMSPGYYGSLNSLFVIALSPVMAWLWTRLNQLGREPSTPAKIGTAMLLLGLAFGLMTLAALSAGKDGQVTGVWLVSTYFTMTLAELCLSPIGLSTVTRLAPARMVGMMMGVWFLANAMGGKLTVWGAQWTEIPHSLFFGVLVGTSLLGAAVIFATLGRFKKAMAGVS